MRLSRHNSLRSANGFTLLELLIATAIGATVLVVINTTFFSALRLSQTTHASIETDRMLNRALGTLRRDLAGLMLPGGVLSGELQTTAFSSLVQDTAGERVSPDFYTSTGRIDGWSPFSDVQKVAYFLAPSEDGGNSHALVRAVTRNLLPAQSTYAEEQVLLPGVASAAVSFFDGSAWTQEWDSSVTATLPAAIKFSILLANRTPGQPDPEPIEILVPILPTTTASQQEAAATGT